AEGGRVSDKSATSLEVGFPILEQHGADGDARIEIAGKAEVTDRAGVGAATGRLHLGDDLHGANFRRAADGAGGKSRAHDVVRGVAGGEFALDVGDDVHDVGVALRGHEVG